MTSLSKTLIVLSITGLSSTAMASSNPDPFSDEPVVLDKRETPREAPSRAEQQRYTEQEQERRVNRGQQTEDPVDALLEGNGRSPEVEMLRGIRDGVREGIDYENLPKPINSGGQKEVPLPTTVEDIYRQAEDFRVRGTINGANIEYSSSQDVYRISGSTDIKEKKEPKPLTIKKNDNGYELATGGKESLPTQLQEEKGEE